ncbi:MAG: hypothetical protein HQ523_16415 [Lentisphaerae bacterium]|nr:hypothetical protein [Lentisphaerota bacterium]
MKWRENGQIQAMAVFLRAVEEGGAEDLFALFEFEAKVTDERLIAVLTKLNTGLNRVYSASK